MTQNPNFPSKLPKLHTLLEPKKGQNTWATFSSCTEADHIKYCIHSLLLTRKGERTYYPDLGSRIMSYFFQQFRTGIVQALEQEIIKTLESFEPRIRIITVQARRDESNLLLLHFLLTYQILSSGFIEQLSLDILP